jgi:hypothetical protein
MPMELRLVIRYPSICCNIQTTLKFARDVYSPGVFVAHRGLAGTPTAWS